jgi:hypothetical protein
MFLSCATEKTISVVDKSSTYCHTQILNYREILRLFTMLDSYVDAYILSPIILSNYCSFASIFLARFIATKIGLLSSQ